MNTIFNQMLSQYKTDNDDSRRNAHYEVMQQIILGGLYRVKLKSGQTIIFYK